MRPGTPQLLRGINDRAALDLLIEHGPLSRSRLGELTGLSKPTASQLLTRLEAAGLVVASGNTRGGPGPRAQLYAVNPDAAHVAALDVTAARILAAVADVTGRIVGEHELRTPRRKAPDAVAHVMEALSGASASAGVPLDAIRHLAIGTPGAFDPRSRRLRYARHLPGWHEPDLLDRIGSETDVALHVDNDVNLAAVAERAVGVARGVDDFVLLWAEEGLGAAIVIDGKPHAGASGGAGEVGFLPLPGADVFRDVRRSNAGAFQELAGGAQVQALARSLKIRARTPEAAVAAALQTPGAGDELLETLALRLALGISALVAVLDPGLVVLSGAVPVAGGTRLLRLVTEQVGSLAVSRPRIALSDVRHRPVLTGALHTALAATRDEVFDTVRHLTTSPGATRHVTRRTP